LGIDDIVSSIWIGGLILSLSFITIDWIAKKWPKLEIDSNAGYFNWKLIIFILMYLFVLIPLKLDHTIGIYRNTIFGIDKIIFGIIVGSVVFLIGIWTDKKIRKVYGKQLFYFQKVVFPVISLIITSLVLYFVTKK